MIAPGARGGAPLAGAGDLPETQTVSRGDSFPRALLARPTLEAARALLGSRLVREPASTPAGRGSGDARSRERRVGRIVEVEAYIGEGDQASHARMGPTPRNRVMFGPPGVAYVYLVYGMHHCLNVVTQPVSQPAALLVRAIEPLEGLEAMRAARSSAGRGRRRPAAPVGSAPHDRRIANERLAAGPGLVAACFDIDRSCNGLDLCDLRSSLRLEPRSSDEPEPEIRATPRIGIGYAGEPWASMPWRLIVSGSPSISGPRTLR